MKWLEEHLGYSHYSHWVIVTDYYGEEIVNL